MKLSEIERFDSTQELSERLYSEYSRISTETFLKWKAINNFNYDVPLDDSTKHESLRAKMLIMTNKLVYRRIIGGESNAVKKMDIILNYLNNIV